MKKVNEMVILGAGLANFEEWTLREKKKSPKRKKSILMSKELKERG